MKSARDEAVKGSKLKANVQTIVYYPIISSKDASARVNDISEDDPKLPILDPLMIVSYFHPVDIHRCCHSMKDYNFAVVFTTDEVNETSIKAQLFQVGGKHIKTLVANSIRTSKNVWPKIKAFKKYDK